MRCPSCESVVNDGRRFCPSCGTPMAVTVGAGARYGAAARQPPSTSQYGAVADGSPPPAPDTARDTSPDTSSDTSPVAGPDTSPETAAIVLPDVPGYAGPGYDAEEVVASDERTTRVLETPAQSHAGHGGHVGARTGHAGERLRGAGAALRRHAGGVGERFRAAPAELRLAFVGAALTLVSFLALPYAADVGTAAGFGGRLWWRPIAAVAATVLLAMALRGDRHGAERHGTDLVLAALTMATVGATEAGLVGLFSGDADGTRIGYYGMLAGLVTVLVATARAARRRCAA